MRRHRIGVILGVASLVGVLSASPGWTDQRTAIVATPHFAFFSDFDTNLNDALIAAGLARKNGKAELFRSGDEAACFDKLPKSVRAAWDGAVEYYRTIISPGSFGDNPQYLVRMQLAGFDDELAKEEDRQFVEMVRGFRMAATPAYKGCRWPTQDEQNRAWIDPLKVQLAAHEEEVATRLATLYKKPLGGLPIPVDVVETVDWSGANTILRDPAGGHILVARENEVSVSLEVVFHEASHTLMGRDAPVRQALDKAAKDADFRLPGDLWHLVLFYTTGEAVRRVLADKGESACKPMLQGIYEKGAWVDYRDSLEKAWRPYIDGKRNLSEAAVDLIKAVRKSADAKGAAGKPRSDR